MQSKSPVFPFFFIVCFFAFFTSKIKFSHFYIIFLLLLNFNYEKKNEFFIEEYKIQNNFSSKRPGFIVFIALTLASIPLWFLSWGLGLSWRNEISLPRIRNDAIVCNRISLSSGFTSHFSTDKVQATKAKNPKKNPSPVSTSSKNPQKQYLAASKSQFATGRGSSSSSHIPSSEEISSSDQNNGNLLKKKSKTLNFKIKTLCQINSF